MIRQSVPLRSTDSLSMMEENREFREAFEAAIIKSFVFYQWQSARANSA